MGNYFNNRHFKFVAAATVLCMLFCLLPAGVAEPSRAAHTAGVAEPSRAAQTAGMAEPAGAVQTSVAVQTSGAAQPSRAAKTAGMAEPAGAVQTSVAVQTSGAAQAYRAAQTARTTVSFSAKSKADKKITVTWKKVKNAAGYEISYGLEGVEDTLDVPDGTATSRTLKDLQGAKIYSLRMRSYRIVDNKKTYSKWSDSKTVKIRYSRWAKLMDKYAGSKKVKQLIFVKYTGGTKATFYMYKKKSGKWKRIIKCKAYVGVNGIRKKNGSGRDDYYTPSGTFKLTWAFGIKDDPGSKLKYYKVNKNHYLCADTHYYNKLINIKKKPHNCRGEHLIDYGKPYYYGAMLDYNKECDYNGDYAIFLHCFSSRDRTAGCIAISEKNMKKVLRNAEKGTRICIYKK